jgi:hypothetical protein
VNSRRELDNVGRDSVMMAVNNRTSLGQQAFHRVLSLERRRAERSRKSFLLMLVDADQRLFGKSDTGIINGRILAALTPITRETDITGWYKEGAIAGALFTEIAEQDLASTTTAIMNRVSKALKNRLAAHIFSTVSLSFHLLPEEHDHTPSSFEATSVGLSGISSPGVAAGVH